MDINDKQIPGQEQKSSPYRGDQVASLAEEIMRHRRLYYAGQPEISDQAFDALEDQLRALAPLHPVLHEVGALTGTGQKAPHDQPMLSLNKTYREEDLLAWTGDEPVVGMLKIDGNSLSIIYESGRFTVAKTRGDGRIGEDVTEKVRWVPSILPQLPLPHRLEIRGELFCSDEQFAKLANEMTERGLERPSAPRNIVAGILGRKSDIDLARYFQFFAFDILTGPDTPLRLTTEMDKFAQLQQWGFMVPEPTLLRGRAEVTSFLTHVHQVISEGNIGCDGAVFSYNDLQRHRQLGSTSHHPRFKLSFKWQGETAESQIKEITWTTSRFGVVTPVAVVDPVRLSGAMITNITLHNAAMVKAYNLKPGDVIELVRSGEVIPKFLRVCQAGSGSYSWPEQCHTCQAPLSFDGVRLKCLNTNHCTAQQSGMILNWMKAVGIDDISEKRLDAMLSLGVVQSIPDLYRLDLERCLQLPLTKERMAQKMLANVARSKNLPLARFLQGLGIPGAGLTTWEKIVSHHPRLNDVLQLTVADLVNIDGFAEKSATQITEGLAARRALIAELLEVGVTPQEEQQLAPGGGPLAGAQIAITGSLSQPRSQLEQLIKQAGGKPVSSVSSNTTALVTNEQDSNSSKMRKARSLGIPIWTEAVLLEKLST